MQIFAQNKDEAAQIRQAGFYKVEMLGSETPFNGIKISKTPGQHGSDMAMARLVSYNVAVARTNVWFQPQLHRYEKF